ncbi:homoisocitrate dehydrogenase [Acrasis kona]|uniref:Homoisocitrate dehydrogenase n=1 Tax=Acrasis kona TaxID=1008807 RepID=A0AAW2YIM1_9EUKA
MRSQLDLYANLRPVKSPKIQVNKSFLGVDMLIVRENTECLYVKQERYDEKEEKAVADRVITKKASKRIAEIAFKQAQLRQSNREQDSQHKKAKVTIVHKSNVMSVTDGLFRESCLSIAEKYPDVQVEEQLVDSMVYKMFLNPQQYDVVVAPNLYGDILSDAGAALVGGLGLVPSANVSDTFTLVEPVHGSAPDIQGKNIANPLATISAAALLLKRIGTEQNKYSLVGSQIEEAVSRTLSDKDAWSPDLGGTATTKQVTDRVIEHLKTLL